MLKIDFTTEEVSKLHYERYHHPHPIVQKKMEALYLKSQGIKHKDICSICKITKTTLTVYIKQYQIGGIEELKKIDDKGRPSKLNEYSDTLKEYFEKNPTSTIAEASDAIERITGIKRSPTQVREFMKRIGLRCLKVGYVPGKSVEEEKQKEIETYRVEKLEPLLDEAVRGEKAVFFLDAAHFVSQHCRRVSLCR